MENKSERTELSLKEQLGTLVKPLNLVKTAAAMIPGASVGSEILNQIEGQRMEKRIISLETTDCHLFDELQRLEASVVHPPPPAINEWPTAVNEYMRRHVDLAVLHSPPEFPDRQYILPSTFGCVIGDDFVLTCSEALDFVQDISTYKRGRAVICYGSGVYYFEPEAVDAATGLVRLKITGRNEDLWEDSNKILGKYMKLATPPKEKLNWSISPYLGQEVGFIVPCESKDNFRGDEMTRLEFGTSVIAHFRLPRDGAIKSFVSSVYSGRIQQAGSAVFARDATLLGIISEVSVYEYDVGRRAVVKSLLGFPEFTKPKLKTK